MRNFDFSPVHVYYFLTSAQVLKSRRNEHEAPKEKSVCDICLREYTTLENMLGTELDNTNIETEHINMLDFI